MNPKGARLMGRLVFPLSHPITYMDFTVYRVSIFFLSFSVVLVAGHESIFGTLRCNARSLVY